MLLWGIYECCGWCIDSCMQALCDVRARFLFAELKQCIDLMRYLFRLKVDMCMTVSYRNDVFAQLSVLKWISIHTTLRYSTICGSVPTLSQQDNHLGTYLGTKSQRAQNDSH